MPKKIPTCPTKPNPPQESVRRYAIELITPMFGGGVKPGVNDTTLPVRATAIRGHLQFWWRATVGARYSTVSKLRENQSAIWGSTKSASQVHVQVEDLKFDAPTPCATIKSDHKGKDRIIWDRVFRINQYPQDDSLPYALFPFQGKRAENNEPRINPANFIAKLRFQLVLRCPNDSWPSIETALWAWTNFGGLGSRTRRGCGAILCKELAPQDDTHFAKQLNQYILHQMDGCEWPTIKERPLLRTTDPADEPFPVWDWLLGLYKYFRQGVEFARNFNQQTNQPGRSRYPEPETIRRITGQRLPRHARLPQIPDDAFPRAEFGLPIVFQFKDSGDPSDTVLYPSKTPDGEKRERMASPLILKPLILQDGKALPIILQLNTVSLDGIELRRGDKSLPLPSSTTINAPRLAEYKNSPLAGSPSGSAIEAFLAFARNEGFTEVTR